MRLLFFYDTLYILLLKTTRRLGIGVGSATLRACGRVGRQQPTTLNKLSIGKCANIVLPMH